MSIRVSIQGYEGSFHQEAAIHFFGSDIQVIPCAQFSEVVQYVNNQAICDAGVMAIENSIAGSILSNYHLLQQYQLEIVGEIYLGIHQQLLVNPGTSIHDIKEVHSHPMALQQCARFLDQYAFKRVETTDTALSAKELHDHQHTHIAVIAGMHAAKLFHLEVLAENIHSHPNNYTRFLVLTKKASAASSRQPNKASVYFHTDHAQGSLANVLTILAARGMNLSKLQSVPINGEAFKYAFHADLEFEQLAHFEDAMLIIQKHTTALRIYGVYEKGHLLQ